MADFCGGKLLAVGAESAEEVVGLNAREASLSLGGVTALVRRSFRVRYDVMGNL